MNMLKIVETWLNQNQNQEHIGHLRQESMFNRDAEALAETIKDYLAEVMALDIISSSSLEYAILWECLKNESFQPMAENILAETLDAYEVMKEKENEKSRSVFTIFPYMTEGDLVEKANQLAPVELDTPEKVKKLLSMGRVDCFIDSNEEYWLSWLSNEGGLAYASVNKNFATAVDEVINFIETRKKD